MYELDRDLAPEQNEEAFLLLLAAKKVGMDPCPFVRLIVESLALKLPPATSKPAGSGVHPSTTPCFCTLNLHSSGSSSSSQTAPLPLSSDTETATPSPTSSSPTIFNLDPSALQRLSGKPASLTVLVYAGRNGNTCGISSARLLGRVSVCVKLEEAAVRPVVMQTGWVRVGKVAKVRLHLVVRSEPDPRFVFQFGGEPECSPVVYQINQRNGNNCSSVRQPVFSCRFSAERRSARSSALPSDPSTTNRKCFGSFGTERDHPREQRKGWTVTIHDLSGSPVAAASMITPFVPSPGSDRVSRSNPGAWLILQPAGFTTNSWKPWGRLEAWRERGPNHALGYKFELVMDPGPNSSIPIAESSLSVRRGGQFCIDPAVVEDVISRSWPFLGGFVMASTVEGEGRVSKPTVQVGVQHVMCMSDAALFIALSAAIDLSMDACRLFSHKLRKELCNDQQEYSS